jgi:hypothetical protein
MKETIKILTTKKFIEGIIGIWFATFFFVIWLLTFIFGYLPISVDYSENLILSEEESYLYDNYYE